MLTQHEKIQPALVKCHAESMIRETPQGIHIPSRFRSVVDDRGTELGSVTDRFKLVQTADVVAAIDLEADRLGYDFTPRAAFYRNGMAKIELDIPARRISMKDGDGGVTPRAIILHGLGGRGGLSVFVGGEIGVCTNGMIFGKLIDVSYARHTKGIDIQRIVAKAIGALDAGIQRTEVLIAAAKRTASNTTIAAEVRETAPERFRRTFDGIFAQNERTYGRTGWALIQSVTELATHHMRERRDGSHVWSADDWSRTQVNAVSNALGLVPAR